MQSERASIQTFETAEHTALPPIEIDDQGILSEIETCHAEGIRRGDWPPCALDDFVIALMRVGARHVG